MLPGHFLKHAIILHYSKGLIKENTLPFDALSSTILYSGYIYINSKTAVVLG